MPTPLNACQAATTCAECSTPYTATRSHSRFCSVKCRREFNNRRQVRGAQLYDLIMLMRYQRAEAKRLQIWTKLCRIAEMFRDEDISKRDGLPSWRDPREIMDDKPYLSATRLPRMKIGRMG